jgi:cytochrome c peroxidase
MQDAKIHDLGLGASGDEYAGFNTPSLRGVSRKVLFLHDGRYDTLEEVLRGDHAPHRVRGDELSEEEFEDLLAYLRTL